MESCVLKVEASRQGKDGKEGLDERNRERKGSRWGREKGWRRERREGETKGMGRDKSGGNDRGKEKREREREGKWGL